MTHEPSRLLRIAAVPLMLLAGAMVAVQSEINGRLATGLGTGTRAGIAAAVISFGTGLILLSVLTMLLRRHRRRVVDLVLAVRARRLRPIELVGGSLGAFLVATQGLTVGTIGVALFSVALTAGQAVNALLVDHLGFGPAGHQALSVPRLVAAAFAVGAVVVATASRLIDTVSAAVVLCALLAFLAGAGSSAQQALNGRVARHVGPWVTTLTNFAVGSVALAIAFALSFLLEGHLGGLPSTWWLYLGGLIGICFIWLAAVLVRVHGVLVLGLSMIAGQVVGAQVVEASVGQHPVSPAGLAAAGLTVVGVVIALALRQRP